MTLGPPGSTTPVSIHLLQRSEAFTTTFTQRGALANLEWRHINQHLSQLRHDSALIHLSSYFRSDLHVGLVDNLRELSRRHVIALDHGRITPAVASSSSVAALREAFRRGYIDFYTCTFDDLWAFAHSADWRPPPSPDARGEQDLRALSQMLRLPPVTIVRDDHWLESGSAYVLLDERVELVSTDADESVHPTGGVGPKNAFNAAFIRTLLRAGAAAEDPMRTVIEATQAGLAAWLDQS